jgi:hypothetical protein
VDLGDILGGGALGALGAILWSRHEKQKFGSKEELLRERSRIDEMLAAIDVEEDFVEAEAQETS